MSLSGMRAFYVQLYGCSRDAARQRWLLFSLEERCVVTTRHTSTWRRGCVCCFGAHRALRSFAALLAALEELELRSYPASTVQVALPEVTCVNDYDGHTGVHDSDRRCCYDVPLLRNGATAATRSCDATACGVAVAGGTTAVAATATTPLGDEPVTSADDGLTDEERLLQEAVGSLSRAPPASDRRSFEAATATPANDGECACATSDPLAAADALLCLLEALAREAENTPALWPSVDEFEQAVSEALDATVAAEMIDGMKTARSKLLLQIGINFLLLLAPPDTDDE